jgi:Tfp pilus assembly protein PilX
VKRELRRQRGSALIITLVVLLALTVLGLGTIMLAGADQEVGVYSRTGDQALYVAEAGVYWGAKQVDANVAVINAPGTNFTPLNMTDGSADVYFPGVSQAAQMTVSVSESADSNGKIIQCGLPGYSDRFGSKRFQVVSTGTGPGGASRQVQAIMTLPPQEGICPPGANVAGCSYQGGC